MTIEFLQENVLPALKTVSKIISSKPQLPILSSILVTAEKGFVHLAATDLYVGIRMSIPAKVDEPFQIAIPGKIFYETVQSLSAGTLTITLKDLTATIKNQKTTTTLQCLEGKDYPAFPDIEDSQKTSLSVEQLNKIQKYVGLSTATDQARLILTAALFQPNGDFVDVVGTDGFRLSLLKLPKTGLETSQPILIPTKALSEVVAEAERLKEDQVSLTQSDEQKQLLFSVGSTQLYVRLVEGEYPPYERIIPSEVAIEVSVDGQELLHHLKQALILAREASNVVQFQIGSENITIKANASSSGSFEAQVPIEVIKAGEVTIAFNARYIQDFLSQVKPARVIIGVNDALKPAILREDGNSEFTYIAMPFRLNE